MISWLRYFWACCEAEHHGGEGVVEQSLLLPGVEERERQGENIPFKDMLLSDLSLPTRLHL
jgi:hypothetical protein